MSTAAWSMARWGESRLREQQRLVSVLSLQEGLEIASPAQHWWSLAVTGLGLTVLMPVSAPVVGTIGALLTLSTAWPLLQESGYALQERRFDVAMLSACAVVGGVMTNHVIVAGVVSSVHHVWQAIHERQALARMRADDTTQDIYIVRCLHVGKTDEGEPILHYLVETHGGNDREGFTDMDELRRSLLERLDAPEVALQAPG